MKKLVLRIFQFKRMYILVLLPLSFVLVALARLDNRWVEHFFVRFIYKPLSAAVGTLTSLLPFSVTELLAAVVLGLLVFYIVRVIIGIVKNPESIKHRLYKLFINALCAVSVALFAFQICMGLNYYRFEASHYLGLSVRESSVEELYELTKSLADDINYYRERLEEDENGVSVLSDKNRYETSKSAREAYRSLSDKYSFLKAADIRNKPLVTSKLFSAVMTTGIYIPYTFESNINVDVPEFSIPATMCHELTHFRGFMRENEANFLGYLACMESPRDDFKYSGAMMAFSYCYPQLSKADKELASLVAQNVSDGVMRDLVFEDEYWEPYRKTVTADISNKVYDSYLNANNQQSGMKSYGEMVDLLLAYRRTLSAENK